MQHTLAILHSEEEYAYSLMNFMNQHREFAFRVIAFTQKQLLFDYLKEHKVQVLLFDESILEEELNSLKITCCFGLTDTPNIDGLCGKKAIFMYQQARKIMSQATEYYALEGNAIPSIKAAVQTKLKVFCSVFGGWKPTMYTIDQAKQLSKENRILFLSFHPFMKANLFETSEEFLLSEAIYTFKMNESNNRCKLNQMIKEYHGIQYLMGVEHFSDLSELNSEEAIGFIDELAKTGEYDLILIDLPMPCFNVTGILSHCEEIYELIESNSYCERMSKEFYRQLELKEGQGILNRFIKVQVDAYPSNLY